MPKTKYVLIRLRVIDGCIRNHYRPYPTLEQLRNACEEKLFGTENGEDIAIRTIERDLTTLKNEYDAPIKYNRERKGYYYEDNDFSLENFPLTQEEIDAIKFAANTLYQFRNTDIFSAYSAAIEKIRSEEHTSELQSH